MLECKEMAQKEVYKEPPLNPDFWNERNICNERETKRR